MAISTANASPAAFLLFDFLLASSWTWFALLLATIATTLRALRLYFPRHVALDTQASAPAVSSVPQDASKVRPCSAVMSSSFSGISLQQSFKRRPGSKSTSSLEKLLHRNRGEFWRPGIEFLSSVLDMRLPSKLKRIASASRVFQGHDAYACATPGKSTDASAEKKGILPAKQVLNSDKASSGFGLGLKFQWKTLTEGNENACQRFSMQDRSHLQDCTKWLPSWAHAVCGPAQLKWSPRSHAGDHVFPFKLVSPIFEKQFGWDKLLDSKLGFPWSVSSRTVSDCSIMERSNVVRMWDDLPKKLIRKLNLDEGSTLALDTYLQEGLACTGNISGNISMWELERRAYVKESAAFTQPVVALSMNSDQRTAVVGSATSIGLWDHRSPSYNLNLASTQPAPISSLKSRESGLCVATDNGSLSMYDLRKLGDGPLVSDVAGRRHTNSPTSDFESNLWEKFAGIAEEHDEVELDFPMEVEAVESNSSNSFMSRVTTFVRAVTYML